MINTHACHDNNMYACTPYPFTICSWNACSLLARAPSIQLFLHQHHPSIFIIIEPMINSPDQIPSFPYYSKVYIPHPNGHKHGGLVIYFHSSITYHQNKRSISHIATNTATSIAIFHISSSLSPYTYHHKQHHMSGMTSYNFLILYLKHSHQEERCQH